MCYVIFFMYCNKWLATIDNVLMCASTEVWKQAIPLLQYCVDAKSNMTLYRCFKANASRFLGAVIVSFFNGTNCVYQWGGVSGLRRVVDELKRTNQEGPRQSSTKSAKRASELGVAATVSK